MDLTDARRDKISGILEKIGIVVFVAGGGDVLFGEPDSGRLFWDVLGVLFGLALLVESVIIIKR